jgi:hypothetical protein
MSVMRVASSVLLLLAMVAIGPSEATAEHRGNKGIGSFLACDRPVEPPRCTSVGDDSVHRVYIDRSVPSGLAAAIRRSLREDYNPTNLRAVAQARITPATDVIVYAADHGQNGAAGWVFCPSEAPQGITAQGDRWCRHQEMYFNLNPRYATYLADDDSRTHLACHELGHTIGLRHWGNPPYSERPVAATCMNADVPNGPQNLHPWDIEEINRYYAGP